MMSFTGAASRPRMTCPALAPAKRSTCSTSSVSFSLSFLDQRAVAFHLVRDARPRRPAGCRRRCGLPLAACAARAKHPPRSSSADPRVAAPVARTDARRTHTPEHQQQDRGGDCEIAAACPRDDGLERSRSITNEQLPAARARGRSADPAGRKRQQAVPPASAGCAPRSPLSPSRQS